MVGSGLLSVARVTFALVGAVALVMGINQAWAGIRGTEFVDVKIISWALLTGLGGLAAAAWVLARGPWRAVASGAGIAAMAFTSAVPIYLLLDTPTPGPDVIALAMIPTLVGLTASGVMARARLTASATERA